MYRYPGLSPFSSDQKNAFFGRTNDISRLRKLIDDYQIITLHGKSGTGKTSFLNAGLIPELDKDKDLDYIKIILFGNNIENYTPEPSITFLPTIKKHFDYDKIITETILDKYVPDHANECWFVLKKLQLLQSYNKNLLLIFDQFETLCYYPDNQINEFEEQLAQIINPDYLPDYIKKGNFISKIKLENINERKLLYEPLNIKVIFTIRTDRIYLLDKLLDRIPSVSKKRYQLFPLTLEKAKQAIEEPAKSDGNFKSPQFTFEPQAIDKILNSLTSNNEHDIESAQIQIICQRIEEQLIEKIKENQDKYNSIIDIDDIPKVNNIFFDFYNDAVAKVETDTTEKVHKFIEDQMIIGVRRISLDEMVCQIYVKKETLNTLLDRRLLSGYFGNADPHFGDIDPTHKKWFKELKT